MPASADIQGAFAGALLSTVRSVPACLKGAAHGRAERRFAIHRNAVAAGLTAALAARFPIVERLVGQDFFRAMAHAYALREPPCSPVLIHYGGSFPDFIGRYAPAAALPYLGDVARLEDARGLAYHAADQTPLPASSFVALDKGRLTDFTVALHPSVFIVTSAYPIVSIWMANRSETDLPLRHRGAETALIARPFLDVETRKLRPGTGAFLSALRMGSTIGTAIAAGEAASPQFSAAEALATLIGANIAVALRAG